MRLRLERLESIDVPVAWQQTLGHFDGDVWLDVAAVAQEGGSCHVVVTSGADGTVLLNEIVFDPEFRGGGRMAVVRGVETDDLLVVPGPGGGPVVKRFDFDGGPSYSFFAPYDREFRGGLRVSSGDLDGDGADEAIFLPGEGGAPRLVAVDLSSFETECSIWVGDPEDLSGTVRFAPDGVTVPLGSFGIGLLVQDGEPVDWSVPSRIFDLAGVDRTLDFISGSGWKP